MPDSFSSLGVSAPVCAVLAKRGFTAPFAVQTLVLPDALAGLDVMAASPTGSGKTLAFALPIVERTAAEGRPGALVLVPTREFATQVVEETLPLARARGLKIAAVYGGASISTQVHRSRDAAILVATPGRLQDLLDRGLVRLDGVSVLVLDEADRMLDMGFRPQVERILRHVPENRQTLLFSATLEGAVADLAKTYTNNPVVVRAEAPIGVERGEIVHEFVQVTADTKIQTLAERLAEAEGLSLVFVRTKHGADKLAKKLERDHSHAAAVMHGNMSQNARERSLARFDSGKVMTLVATDVAARGLDVDDIVQVVNFDPPGSDEDYVHRVGRTGRAGRSGTGVTFVLAEQEREVAQLAQRLGHGEAFAASGMAPVRPKPAHQPNAHGQGGNRSFKPRRQRSR